MQTCSQCHTTSPDSAILCAQCGVELLLFSEGALALKRMQENPRIMNVRLAVADDCCPACREAERSYQKDQAPSLPIEGCSHKLGCRCFYEPALESIFP